MQPRSQHHTVSIFTGWKKTWLSYLCSPEISYVICWKDFFKVRDSTCQIWSKSLQLISRYEWAKFCFSYHHLNFAHFTFSAINSQMRAPILVLIKGLLKHIFVPILAGIWLGFMELRGIICIKIRSKVCHTYKVNCLKEWVKTWHVTGVTIIKVPFFCGLKQIELENGDMKPSVKITQLSFVNKNLLVCMCSS